ncbi:hypothetical protein, partial [Falsihalocynthiibacter sp. CO-5D18]|uniref:hypothetical protein n=1 Tax=Falsihalocynthiibacter sp. CO-5D18 TaxID=3240872 RepID=UPI00387E2181
RRIARIWGSLYLVIFIKNLLRYLAEKILLLNTTNFRGDYQPNDVFKNRHLSLPAGFPSVAPDQFSFDGFEGKRRPRPIDFRLAVGGAVNFWRI